VTPSGSPAQPGYGYGPPPGAAPENPYGAPSAGAGAPPPPPPPHNPYASSPGAAPQNPYGGQPQYPTQGQVQQGYGAAPAYGAPVYGAPGYGQPTYAAPQSLTGNTITLLVISGLTTIGCGFGIVALVFAIVAAAKKDQPAESAKYTRWGWIALVAGLVLTILVVVIFVVAIAGSSSSSYNSGY
jgi:hypothetical protein